MLKKLIKYDWRATWKVMTMMNLFLLVVTLLGILTFHLNLWDSDNKYVVGIGMFALMFYYLSIIAISIASVIYIAVRFYKNLYTDEGYLTHTLPVSSKLLISSKIIVGSFWVLITMVVIFISVVALAFGLVTSLENTDFMSQLSQGLHDLGPFVQKELGISLGFLVFFIILFCVLGSISSVITVFGAVSFGQLFQKHKVLGSILSYIGIYMVLQTVSSLALIPFTAASFVNEQDIKLLLYGVFYSGIIESVLFSVVLFFVSDYIMRKKLNLE